MQANAVIEREIRQQCLDEYQCAETDKLYA